MPFGPTKGATEGKKQVILSIQVIAGMKYIRRSKLVLISVYLSLQ